MLADQPRYAAIASEIIVQRDGMRFRVFFFFSLLSHECKCHTVAELIFKHVTSLPRESRNFVICELRSLVIETFLPIKSKWVSYFPFLNGPRVENSVVKLKQMLMGG